MNKLVLIGNGFDLAHGLKTRYTDFILWYLNKVCLKLFNGHNSVTDELITLRAASSIIPKRDKFENVSEFFEFVRINMIDVTYFHLFFLEIAKATNKKNWVNIEYEYYKYLIRVFNSYLNTPDEKEILQLNKCLDKIKMQLTEYLTTEIKIPDEPNKEILNLLQSEIEKSKEVGDQILFLNFNYTGLIELYRDNFFRGSKIIYIHGNLKDLTNYPMIFGYGDETDTYYKEIERLNINAFLNNFKSFDYFKTKNYQDLIGFVESAPFCVFTIGHSCGLSDRILLKSIFESENCKRIKVVYHKSNEKDNDYFERTQEISRHFDNNAKGIMRKKIVSFQECSPLLGYKFK